MNTVKRHRGEPEHTDKHSGPVQKQKSEEDRHQTERSGARTPIKRGGAGTHITAVLRWEPDTMPRSRGHRCSFNCSTGTDTVPVQKHKRCYYGLTVGALPAARWRGRGGL